MGAITRYDSVPQDPMFGISHENIVSRLTRRNWRTKATALTQGMFGELKATPGLAGQKL